MSQSTTSPFEIVALDKKPATTRLRLTLLGILFVAVVIAVTYYQRSFLVPLFFGMSVTIKGLFKLLTPKFLVLLFKNSVFLKIKQLLIRGSTRFVVLSHRPWRHRMRWIKTSLSQFILRVIRYYIEAPLWLRTAIALGLLVATASSSYVVLALLIIPQPILAWLRRIFFTTLNRTGITHIFNVIWKYLVPKDTQRKWYMHRKWTMGRRQIKTARKLRETIFTNTQLPRDRSDKKSPGEPE